MTIQEHIQHPKTTPAQAYRALSLLDTRNASHATLSELQGLSYEGAFGPNSYAGEFALACVKSICAAYQRANPMKEEEQKATAEEIIVNFPYLTERELRLFESKLVTGNIEYNGEYDLKEVSRNTILKRLRVFAERMHPEQVSPKAQDIRPGVERPPRCESDPWKQTHNFYGELMPSGWNYRAHWTGDAKTPQDMAQREKINARLAFFKAFYDGLKAKYGRKYQEALEAGLIPQPYEVQVPC